MDERSKRGEGQRAARGMAEVGTQRARRTQCRTAKRHKATSVEEICQLLPTRRAPHPPHPALTVIKLM